MFKKQYKELDKSASLEEVIEFMNELSEKIYHNKLRTHDIDPHEQRSAYDLQRNARDIKKYL